MHPIPTLPNGVPGQRLRHLAGRYHAFGPRALLDLFERLIDGRLPDPIAVVEFLERCARTDPSIIKAVGGYELESPIFDVTWVIDMDRRLGRVPRPRRLVRRPANAPPLRLVQRCRPSEPPENAA